MKWEPCKIGAWVSPTSQQSDAGHLLCRSPQDGYVTDGRVCYTLSLRGRLVKSQWAEDTPADRLRVVRELKALAEQPEPVNE